jgi:hypothetical protein
VERPSEIVIGEVGVATYWEERPTLTTAVKSPVTACFWTARFQAQLDIQRTLADVEIKDVVSDEGQVRRLLTLEMMAQHGAPFAWDANTSDLLESAILEVPSGGLDITPDDMVTPFMFMTFARPLTAFRATGLCLGRAKTVATPADGQRVMRLEHDGQELLIVILGEVRSELSHVLASFYPVAVGSTILGVTTFATTWATDAMSRFAYAALQFANDKLLRVGHERPSRAQRRALARSEKPEPLIKTVSLRRLTYEGTSREATLQDWSCQWIVRGHWRNQWCPSIATHRPTWVSSYVKGPHDKPLKRPSLKVFAVNR